MSAFATSWSFWPPVAWAVAMIVALFGGPGGSALGRAPTTETFAISAAPTPADWRYFLKAPERSRAKLWSHHAAQGKKLKDWSWGWRLGWVRACGLVTSAPCPEIIDQALTDKALVVRAEAASWLGRRLAGTADARATSQLKSAFLNPRNHRHGRPLFVEQRILFALHQVGGPDADAAGAELAAADPALELYWQKLRSAEEATPSAAQGVKMPLLF